MTSHGIEPRGESGTSQSALHEGRFGRMFRRLAPAPHLPDEALQAVAETMREGAEAGGWNAAQPVQDGDNAEIASAYTYFGQFVDHDITFDPASSLQQQNDPDALTDFRSPRFDLDCLFGSGPADEPFQYVPRTTPPRLLLEKNVRGEMDLPRTTHGIAIIGDPRNDENTVVSQLQLTFARAYNHFAAQVEGDAAVPAADKFRAAQRLMRWHYQWVIAFDFLPKICGQELVDKLLTRNEDKTWKITRPHYQPRNNAYMPVEFSVAAYRFGHSQVRATYDLNDVVVQRPIFAPGDETGELDDLRGFRPLPSQWTIDWSHFLPQPGVDAPHQPSRLINSKLSAALFDLPGESDPEKQSLAFRNLKRGQSMNLPSGQAVAGLLAAPHVYSGAELGAPEPTPLWFYILKEAELETGGQRLGHCGAAIVAEVFLGLLEVDRHSWINSSPAWQPQQVASGGTFGLADLVALGKPDPSAA